MPLKLVKTNIIERATKRYPEMKPARAIRIYKFDEKLQRLIEEFGEDASETRAFITRSMLELDEFDRWLKQQKDDE